MKRMKLLCAMALFGLCHASPIVVLDVSNPAAVVVGGSQNVLQWSDVSGSGNHAIPGNSSLTFPDPAPLGSNHAGIGMNPEPGGGLRILTAAQANETMDFSGSDRLPGFSALMALKIKSLPGTKGTILGTAATPSSGGFAVELDPSGRLTASLGGNSVASAQGADPLLLAGSSLVIGVVYNAGSQQLAVIDSVNDTLRTLGVSRSDFTTNKDLLLGQSPVSGNGVSLIISELQLFERPLSPAQLAEETRRMKHQWVTGSAPIQHISIEDPGDLQTSGANALTQWTDRSGFGNHGSSDAGSMTFPGFADPATGARMLDTRSSNDTLSLFDASEQDTWLDFTGNASSKSGFTVLLAFKPSGFVSNWNDILGNDSAFSRGFVLRTSGTGQPVVSLGGTDLRSSARIDVGDTIFYALRYDAVAGEYLFWNSKNDETLVRTLAAGDFSGSMPVRLGRADNPGRYFKGDFLEAKVFDSRISDDQLEKEKVSMDAKWKPAELPVEVLGAEGTTEERHFYLNASQLAAAEQLWFQANSVTYQDKGSIRVNDEPWLSLNHNTTDIQSQELVRGGMVHGGFNTIRFRVPTTNLKEGLNRIRFRFNKSDTISIGYRIVRFNVLDAGNSMLLPSNLFAESDPLSWQPPHSDQASIDEGERLWRGVTDLGTMNKGGRGRQLWNHYKADDTEGWWYGYDLPVRKTIQASCTDCHTQDGRDLEMFSYSNHSIIERSKFHNLTTVEGEKIASYIRSLSGTFANVDRAGRPWNPPYQPGPSVANLPIHQWSAGAGVDAVLDDDSDMAPYLFPDGMDDQELDDFFDVDGNYDSTVLPLAVQFPDWKHWLPMVHPMDAFTGDTNTPGLPVYFDDSMSHSPKRGLEEFRSYLESIPEDPAQKEQFLLTNRIDHLNKHRVMNDNFRYFFQDGADATEHWRSENGLAQQALPADLPREFAATSLSRLLAIRNFEFSNEFDLQDKAHLFTDYPEIDHPQPRQWLSKAFAVYTVGPHFQASVEGVYKGQQIPAISRYFLGQPRETGTYESTNWYEMQAVLNAGQGRMAARTDPVDYNYQHTLIVDAGQESGVLEPFRYIHTAARMYQTKLDSRSFAPDNGSGFLIRNMGPWYLFPNVGSSPLSMMAKFDETEPGLSTRMVNAHLEQFNEEMRKPGYEIDDWMRSSELPVGSQNISNVLDDPGAEDFWSWSSKFYAATPYFVQIGTDPAQLNSLVGWCSRAWPYISWETARSQWFPTASRNSKNALKAFDGDIGTRWATNQGQAPGQWFQVDMLVPRTLDQIVLDQGSSSGDYPRNYEVHVSSNGINWGPPVVTGTGSPGATTIAFAPQTARYFRITQTGSTGPYWSIHELSVYSSGVQVMPQTGPTGLLATATSLGQIDLTWQPANGSGTYNIKRSLAPGGPYTAIELNNPTTSYVDTGLDPSTAYYYVVSENTSSGESPDSIELSVMTPDEILDRSGWLASASRKTGNANRAIDNAISTRWDTAQPQQPGQWFQLDMLSVRSFKRITLDQGSSSNDWPDSYDVSVSNDAVNWGSPIASGIGHSGLITIDFPTQSARYIRITQTGSGQTHYWSIHELNVITGPQPPAMTMGSWLAQSGASDQTPAGDEDHDGLPNIWEYLFSATPPFPPFDPTVSDNVGLVKKVSADTSNHLQFHLTVPNTFPEGISITIQGSNDLVNWGAVSTDGGVDTDNGDGTSTRVWTQQHSMSSEDGMRFMRAGVSEN